MTTLAQVRELVRTELGEAAGGETWDDTELDRHISRANEELSAAWPRETVETVATTAGSRDISVAAVAGLIELEAVEYPLDSYPPSYVAFSVWGSTATLHLDSEPDGDDAKLYVTARHTLDGSGTTLSSFQVELVVSAAAAYAAIERSAGLTNQLTTATNVPERFAAYGRARLTAFHQLLHHHGRKNRVRGRRLYVPA